MKILHFKPRGWGFSFLDFLIVVFIILVLAGILLPKLSGHGSKKVAKRIGCLNNLRQVGLAFQSWADDHPRRFPMAVSTNEGGLMEYNQSGEIVRYFLFLSNELHVPKILVCPEDPSRKKLEDWNLGLSNSNISYFVTLEADPLQPHWILSGDRNITGGVMSATTMFLKSNNPVGWTKDMHKNAGNICLADASVHQVTTELLRHYIQASTNPTIRLAIP